MIWQYWQHKTSGDVYAVGVSSVFDGANERELVEEACGPLHYSEVTEKNLQDGNFNSDPDTTEWIRQNEESFSLWDRAISGNS